MPPHLTTPFLVSCERGHPKLTTLGRDYGIPPAASFEAKILLPAGSSLGAVTLGTTGCGERPRAPKTGLGQAATGHISTVALGYRIHSEVTKAGHRQEHSGCLV